MNTKDLLITVLGENQQEGQSGYYAIAAMPL